MSYARYYNVEPASKPTIRPAQPFDPKVDAKTLKDAMQGFGANQKTIIDVISRRSLDQRIEIANQFKTMFNANLIDELKSHLGGDFEDAIVALMTPLVELFAHELHDAMSGLRTDEAAIVEILATLTNHGVKFVAESYKKLFGKDLVEDLKGDTSGDFQKLLLLLCQGTRNEEAYPSDEVATDYARRLIAADTKENGKWVVGPIIFEKMLLELKSENRPEESDEALFSRLMVTRSFRELKVIIEKYEKLSGRSIEETVRQHFAGDTVEAFIALVKCFRNRTAYFAEVLHKSIAGIGTDEKTLTRVIVRRSENDLGDIKDAYKKMYGSSLAQDIEGDCSGDYKGLLLAILG